MCYLNVLRDPCHIGDKIRVLYDSSHDQLPPHLFARVRQVHERGSDKSRPKYDSQVASVHLVDFLLQVHLVEVMHQETKCAEVWAWHAAEDLVDTCALGLGIQSWGGRGGRGGREEGEGKKRGREGENGGEGRERGKREEGEGKKRGRKIMGGGRRG